MHFFSEVFTYFSTRANWTGSGGIPNLFYKQALLSATVVVAATLVGGGLGLVLGHTGRGGLVAVNAANAFRAVPTLALLTLLAIQPSISLKYNGFLAAFIALVVLAIPPILTNTYVGIREVDADIVDASRAMGLTGPQILGRVELPLGLPFIVAGIRTASIEVVATSTLAAYVSYQDLGTPVLAGLASQNTVEAFCGSLLVAVLAAIVAIGLGLVLKAVTPAALRKTSAPTSLLPGAVSARPQPAAAG
ncbi:MAG TPA: ABC transporter permease subunit [Acidimicrobiales bacterium]|jgi:osmoprotectant transport system permease protein|nr:ABC transporter permease subunit [Acidimicrobiales bacterium]